MKIAIEGCAHGELEKIYDLLELMQERNKIKIDLLICCGDFQATRNLDDLETMACPPKYRDMCSFYKYYSGEKVAPVLTLFIGGNHEASNHLQELSYGGWVAPNIYYMGLAGVFNIGGLRIGGISGISKPKDYMKGRYEKPPYSEDTKRSIYHIRNLEVFRLKQLSSPIDIFISHDWPRGVHKYGDFEKLIQIKPYFEEEMKSNTLGSEPTEELLNHLQPSYWFSAHLHCKFPALVPHESTGKTTKFLALDKCLPRRMFLQLLDIPHDETKPLELEYDVEWLSILHQTNHLISYGRSINILPVEGSGERCNFTPTEEEKSFIMKKVSNDLRVPLNFTITASPYDPSTKQSLSPQVNPPNPQTREFCDKIGISDPYATLLDKCETPYKTYPDEEDDKSTSFISYESDLSINCSTDALDLSSSNIEPEEPVTPNSVRSAINLPAPKLDSEPIMKEEPRISLDGDDDLGFYICRQPDPVDDVDEKPVQNKKFRRRNYDMYKPDNDEN